MSVGVVEHIGVPAAHDSSTDDISAKKQENVTDADKFFIQYNNVPIGMEVYGDRVFITIPRRRHGIPSTLNYVKKSCDDSPALKPYPDTKSRSKFISVYRPRVDVCGRLWMVDTGHLEVPGERKQIQPPAIVVYDLRTDKQLFRYELKSTDLVNERSSAGLTSITIEVDKKSCNNAYAYINDLATEGMIVFSLKDMDSWRLDHRSFVHDERAMNFTAAGYVINWKDGLFSITLTDPDVNGKRKAFYHPLVSTQEFAINTELLKDKTKFLGHNTVNLKVIGDEIYVLVNQIPKFIYSRFDTEEYNYLIHRYRVFDLILGTVISQGSLGRFQEVFAWKQLTYNIGGNLVLQDRFADDVSDARSKRESDIIFFDDKEEDTREWNQGPPEPLPETKGTTTVRPLDEEGRFFVQYNNVPMGVERVGDRLFVTVPRRRYGSPQQVQQPAIVIYDLRTDQQILRYPFKSSDIPAANTPTGLASITIDITGDCSDAYAYVPDLTTFGLIVYSLKENDSWRLTHNYFFLSPTAGNFRVAGQNFQWGDGIFSVTLTQPGKDGCRTAYFHPLVSFQEFSVSTCLLKNKTANTDSNFWSRFSEVGFRGQDSQCTMHGYHANSRVVFFAEVGRDAVSCWHSGRMLSPNNIVILAQDRQKMSYPSDLHVTNDEVWVMANTLPRFGYSTLDTNEYNFYIYRGRVKDLIRGTACDDVM
ncbi:Protein yellow [Papilio xuthus]|uniref:Protein yellow n=1 Tax=Papilio xuthus TaxID=66420 RepID=A0A0N1I452_PAPXU|nr:Protein yellow [Papilio xuthus]